MQCQASGLQTDYNIIVHFTVVILCVCYAQKMPNFLLYIFTIVFNFQTIVSKFYMLVTVQLSAYL